MKKEKIFLILAAVIILVAAAVTATVYFNSASEKSKDITTTTEEISTTAEVVDPDSIVWDDGGYEGISDGLINFLFIGQDKREGEGRQRSDAMILCSLNPATNELSMISFMRDLYVQIPGYEDNRLNAAYAYGGFDLLKETLMLNFGVQVDGCLEVDFESFTKIVDTIGGIDIELSAKEAEIVGGGATEGICHLDGAQTLTYARIRKIDSDFERTKRQRNILSAVFLKLKDMDIMGRLGFVSEVFPLVATDMDNSSLMSLASKLAASLDNLAVETYRIPADGAYKNATVREMAVLIPDIEKNRKAIFEEYLPQ